MFFKTKFMALAVATALVGALGAGIGSARATVLTNGCADADTCTFKELVEEGATIQVNDKLFKDWNLVDDSGGDIEPDFSNIFVSGLDDGGLDPGPGLKYSFNDELTVDDALNQEFYNLIFVYTVDVLDPGLKIKDNTLTLGEHSFSAGLGQGGLVDIEEFAFDVNEDPLFDDPKFVVHDNLEICNVVSCDGFAGPNPDFGVFPEDYRVFSPQSTIFVLTDIVVFTDLVDDNIVQLRMFEQRFSQTAVPEPGTLTLFGLGLAGLGFARRRKAA